MCEILSVLAVSPGQAVTDRASNSFLFLLCSGAASLYMLSSGDAQLFEVKAFEDDFHSWFVGQTVQRGQFHFSSLLKN